jgi:hypothetical protein
MGARVDSCLMSSAEYVECWALSGKRREPCLFAARAGAHPREFRAPVLICGRVLSIPARGKFPPWNSNTVSPSSALSSACGA